MAGNSDCRVRPNLAEMKVKVKLGTCSKSAREGDSVLYRQFVGKNCQILARKCTNKIDMKRLGAAERKMIRRINGRARNMEGKNWAGTEGAVKV
jgi:hypothetical protein